MNYDFETTVRGWRDDEAVAGRDSEGDRLAARAEQRFLRETYSDSQDYEPECTCYFSGDMADASDCDAHGSRRSMLIDAGLTPAEQRAWDRLCQMELFPARKPSQAAELLNSVDDLMLDEGVA